MDKNICDLTWREYEKLLGLDMCHQIKPGIATKSLGHVSLSDEIPSSLDWRDKRGMFGSRKVAAIRNQRGFGSGWAFTAVACLETAYCISWELYDYYEFSEQQLVDSLPFGRNVSHYTWAWDHIIKVGGISYRFDYPYVGEKTECESSEVSKHAKPKGYAVIPEDDKSIMNAVYKYGQVAVSINAASEEFKNYKSGIFNVDNYAGSKELNHAVTIVGYGTENNWFFKNEDYWIIRNSWGQNWGENGYMRVVRGKNMCGINLNAYVVYY